MLSSNLRRSVIAACCIACGALLGGFQTSAQTASAEEGWIPFTQGELFGYLAGKTQVWDPNGGAYYAEDGSLDTLWDGTREAGTWSVTESGALCWQVPSWGQLECEAYFHLGGNVMYSYSGESGLASDRQDGNTLDRLAAVSAGLADPDLDRDLLTPAEAEDLVSGMTALLDKQGAGYYAADGALTTVWNGVQHVGTWSIDKEGGICWHVEAWGIEPCRYYHRTDEGLMNYYKGRDLEAEKFVDGDVRRVATLMGDLNSASSSRSPEELR